MRRCWISAMLAIASTVVAVAGARPAAALVPVRVAGPIASLRSASADGMVLVVNDGAKDVLVDRRSSVAVALGFLGGLLTPDGGHVLYAAPDASAPGGARSTLDTFRYEVATGASVLLTGGLDDAWTYVPTSSSADGSLVALDATRARPPDRQALVLDTVAGVAIAPDATLEPGESFGLSLSADGRRGVFIGFAASGGRPQLHLYRAGAVGPSRLTSTPYDEPSKGAARAPTMSADGRAVVYVSDVVDGLVPERPAAGSVPMVLVYDVDDGRTTPVAVADASGVDDRPSISADGTRVAYLQSAPTGASGALAPQPFVRDLSDGTVTQLTSGAGRPEAPATTARLAADGRSVLWGTATMSTAGAAVWTGELPGPPACTVTGTVGRDTLSGTKGPDVICGLDGDDTIRGLGGDDVIRGGPGADTLAGGAGHDRLDGGDGDDNIDGGAGNDVIAGGRGRDTLVGGSGDDAISGGDGNDVVRSGAGQDDVAAGAGNDVVDAGSGDDVVFGGDGSDVVDTGPGQDVVDGGAGSDLVRASTGNDAVYGRAGADDLRGLGGDDRLSGGDGNDALSGGAGEDDLRGDAGTDVLKGNGGHDRLLGGDGNDQLDGGAGTDTLDGGPGRDACRSGVGAGPKVNCEAT